MSSKCTVQFDNNPIGVYYAGQNCSGSVELITSRAKNIRSIHITVNGYSETRWTETVRKANNEGKTESVEEPCTAIEQYLSNQTFVYGQSGGGTINLPAGKYLFVFQCYIPPNVPTSLNGEYGHIRYEVVVTIDRHLRYDNVFKEPFTVISQLDLNLDQQYLKPIEMKEEKKFLCAWCCGNNDPIIVTVSFPYSGYVPGQDINFNIVVDNKSNTDVTSIIVKLKKVVKFTCRTPKTENKTNITKICEKRLDGAPKKDRKEFLDVLEIPSTTPSTLESCSIIHCAYVVIINVKLSGLHLSMELKIPITVGTLPLIASIGNKNSTVTNQPGGDRSQHIFAPPNFEEDINKKKLFHSNDQYEKFMKVSDYVPKYPVFFQTGVSGLVGALTSLAPALSLNPNPIPNANIPGANSTNNLQPPSTSLYPNPSPNFNRSGGDVTYPILDHSPNMRRAENVTPSAPRESIAPTDVDLSQYPNPLDLAASIAARNGSNSNNKSNPPYPTSDTNNSSPGWKN